MADHVAGPKHTADYFDPVNEPEPSAETGLGTHFNNTFDPSLKKEAPALPRSKVAAATGEAASAKLASTSSSMTTKELQQAAVEGDPNGLTNGLVPPDMGTKKAPTLET